MAIDALLRHVCILTTFNYGVGPVRRHLMDRPPACIERGVWLRDNVTILSRMTIGVDAMVIVVSAAIRNVPAGAVVGGMPARKLQNL